MIEVESVTKRFGPFTAVRDLSFTVQKGEILGLLGPNGAGKTTTMRVLTGFLPPSEGTARVAGIDVVNEPIEAKRKLGYLPETPPIYPEMYVRDYLDFVARIKGVPARSRRSRVDEAIDKCALSDVGSKIAGRLSKGYRQRLGLAQALVHEPEVLILDEPTAGLDPMQINETRALVRGLKGAHTVILSTHILPEVSLTCERIVIINRGRVMAEGTAKSLTEQLLQHDVVELVVEGPEEAARSAISTVPGVETIEAEPRGENVNVYRVAVAEGRDARRELAAAIVSQELGLLELVQRGMTLEEVYLRVVASEEEAA